MIVTFGNDLSTPTNLSWACAEEPVNVKGAIWCIAVVASLDTQLGDDGQADNLPFCSPILGIGLKAATKSRRNKKPMANKITITPKNILHPLNKFLIKSLILECLSERGLNVSFVFSKAKTIYFTFPIFEMRPKPLFFVEAKRSLLFLFSFRNSSRDCGYVDKWMRVAYMLVYVLYFRIYGGFKLSYSYPHEDHMWIENVQNFEKIAVIHIENVVIHIVLIRLSTVWIILRAILGYFARAGDNLGTKINIAIVCIELRWPALQTLPTIDRCAEWNGSR